MTQRQTEKQSRDSAPGISSYIAGAMVAAAGGWMLYSRFGINHQVVFPEAIAAARESSTSSRVGRVSYYVDRQAPSETRPLVLIHSINATASAYEMKTLFEAYRGTRPVFAIELPGFGFSERSKRIYSALLYQDTIVEFLAGIVGQPADVVALSLSSEFAARAAQARPELFHSLSVISPTGLAGLAWSSNSQQSGAVGFDNLIHPLLSLRLWALPLFDTIVSRTSIEFFLRKNFVGLIPPGFIEYAYAASHQPGAEYAPLHFVSGKLFTPQIRERVYEQLRIPVLAIYDRDPHTGFETLPDLLLKNYRWQAVRLVPSLGLPHIERTADTVEVLQGFWRGLK